MEQAKCMVELDQGLSSVLRGIILFLCVSLHQICSLSGECLNVTINLLPQSNSQPTPHKVYPFYTHCTPAHSLANSLNCSQTYCNPVPVYVLTDKWGWNSKHYNCISTSHNQFQYNNQTMSFPRETQLQEWPTSTVHRVCQLARMPETLARPHSSWSKTTVLD